MELQVELNQESGITVVASLDQIQVVRKYFNCVIALRTDKKMFNGATVELNDAKL